MINFPLLGLFPEKTIVGKVCRVTGLGRRGRLERGSEGSIQELTPFRRPNTFHINFILLAQGWRAGLSIGALCQTIKVSLLAYYMADKKSVNGLLWFFERGLLLGSALMSHILPIAMTAKDCPPHREIPNPYFH